MTEQEAYQEHIRYTHDTYCRIVIRHASFDAARMLAARWKREISLEYLTEEKFVPLSTTDEYFQVPDYGETYPFSVRGQTILLDSCSEPFPEKRTQKVKKKWNDSRGIRYRWLCSGAEKIILKTRGGNPTQSRVRAEGVVEDFQIGKDIALRRRSGWIVF